MAKKTYAFLRGAPKRLEFSWGTFWRNFTVRLDGIELGKINNDKELKAGKQFQLSDGSTLKIQLTKGQLQVVRNDKPLPDSPSDPTKNFQAGYAVIFFIAIVNIVFPLIGLTPGNTPSSDLGRAITVGIGVTFGVLGLFARDRSRNAVWIALGIYILDTFLTIFAVLTGSLSSFPYLTGIIVRPFFIYTMYKTFEGIDYLEQVIPDPQPPIQTALPGIDNPVTTRDKLHEAHRLMTTGGDRQRAKTLVNEALRDDTTNPDCWYMAAYFAENLNQKRSALERTLDLNPNHSGAKKALERLKESFVAVDNETPAAK